MKTLHVVYSFAPDPAGGTEVYVEALARHLEQSGIRAVVAAPGAGTERYELEGLAVRRFAAGQGPLTIGDLYGSGDAKAAEAFEAILDDERPDLVHQHALTAACSVQVAERAKRRGIPVVFTYHTPTVSCQRGSLIELGRAVCDGRLDASRCAACTLQLHGVGSRVGRMLARTPGVVDTLAGKAGLSGGAWTALRMRALTRRRIAALVTLFGLVDRFVALAPWVRTLLEVNGVDAGRIVDCAHGLPGRTVVEPLARRTPGARLRVAHLGRIDPLKGTAVLIEALRASPDAPIDLDIFGVVQSDAGATHFEALRLKAQGDPRITFLPPIAHTAVVERLATYDLVAVPSQWMETGPLVVLEAFAAGVPVLGSDLGGIRDKVTEGVDGMLVSPYDSVQAWRTALLRCCQDRDAASRLARGIQPVRSSAEVAGEMAALYRELVAAAPSRHSAREAAIAASRP